MGSAEMEGELWEWGRHRASLLLLPRQSSGPCSALHRHRRALGVWWGRGGEEEAGGHLAP